MNREEFIKEVKKLGINITKEHLDKLDIYYQTMIEYNEHTNITAIKTLDKTYLNHFYDSLTVVKSIDLSKNLKVLDIGSGAGFPGMVLKIFYPNLEITLLDSNNKKTKFLELLCQKLHMDDVKVINERSEIYVKNNRSYYDVVVARAVSHLRILLELAVPFLKIGGKFMAMKGNINEELEESLETAQIMKTTLINTISFNLPVSDSTRNILTFEKIMENEDIYPRMYDKILKYPLKKNNK